MAGHILDQRAAAVDIEGAFRHFAAEYGDIEGVDGPHPVADPGGLGLPGHDPDGQVGVDGAHFGDQGLQNGLVPGVAPAVGPTDHHAVPLSLLFTPLPAQDGFVDVQLAADGALNGEIPPSLVQQLLPQTAAQLRVPGQGGQMPPQGLVVPGLKQQAGDVVLNEGGHAAHGAGHGGQGEPGPFGEGVGEGLGQGGEGVDIQGVVKAVGVGQPPGKAHLVCHPQLLGQRFQHGLVLALPGDDEAQAGLFPVGGGKAPQQGAHVLHRVEPGGDARDDHAVRPVQPQAVQKRPAAQPGGAGGEVDSVVDGEHLLGVEAPADEQVPHGVGYPDLVGDAPQSPGVEIAVGEGGQGTAHVVQLGVGVDGGDHGQAGGLPQ